MKPHMKSIKYPALAATIFLAACGTEYDTMTVETIAPQGSALTASAATWLDESKSRTRFIGIKHPDGQACPNPSVAGSNSVFEVAPLFANQQGNDNTQQQPREWALRQYCLYETQYTLAFGPGRDIPVDLEAILCNGNNAPDCLMQVSPDRYAVGAYGSANPKSQFSQIMAPLFEQEFLEHSGYVPAASDFRYDDTKPVRLAFLDTSRTEGPANIRVASRNRTINRNSEHGLLMTRIAEKHLCPEGLSSCFADITSQLAMPYVVEAEEIVDSATALSLIVEDKNKGGQFGSISWLAQAVNREVEAWQQAKESYNSPNPDQRLILNMSLGWMPAYGGGFDDDPIALREFNRFSIQDRKDYIENTWPADVAAAFTAIRTARCKGVLMVAASGNKSGGQDYTENPLLPAAWEQTNAPTAAECEFYAQGPMGSAAGSNNGSQFYGIDSASLSNWRAQPMLYAVSGVTRTGSDIGNQRKGARAHLAAYADHASLQDYREELDSWLSGMGYSLDTYLGEDSSIYITAQTGTSVGAAVVATAAAAMWRYNQHYPVQRIMRDLYASGEAVEETVTIGSTSVTQNVDAEFCHGKTCRESKRITVCDAMAKYNSSITCGTWGKEADPIPSTAAEKATFTAASLATALHHSGYVSLGMSSTAVTDPVCGSGHTSLYPDVTVDGINYLESEMCPEDQAYNYTAAPWTLPQPSGGGGGCGGGDCGMFASSGMVALSSTSMNFNLFSSPTLSITNTSGAVTNFSLGSLSGFNISMNFGAGAFGSSSSIKSASFSGYTSSYSFSNPIYLGF